MATQEVSNQPQSTSLFQQLDAYPWSEDTEFQGGLNAILGSVQNAQQVEHLTLRAKCYYYARKIGTPVDFDGYKRWTEEHGGGGAVNGNAQIAQIVSSESSGNDPSGVAEAPKPASFAEICDMIAEGKPIPGIKDIPDTILAGQSSESQASRRKKPWEKESAANDEPSWMTAS